jgi:dolichyl-phosphate beta-glucosyltransferase
VVIPAFDEGQRLPQFLRDLTRIGATVRHLRVDFLVVDDGSSPEHAGRHAAAVVEAERDLQEAGSPHRVRLVVQPQNQGKGAAIRRGWSESRREAGWLGFVDADGAVAAPEVWRLIGMLEPAAPFDLLAGSRVLMAGRSIERSPFRHFQGRIFATMAERTLQLGFYDTQCGFKLARADMLRRVLPSLQERGWLLDLELIALLQRAGARCLEAPIDWADAGNSKVRFGIDALRMAIGLWRMRRRIDAIRPSLAVVPPADQGELEPRAAVGDRRR